MYVPWKGVRGKLIVGLIIASAQLGAWYFVAYIYGWEPFPWWHTIVRKVSELKPNLDNLYDGIRFTVDRIGEGLQKVERVLREGKWYRW
jgi:hypothetical protein